MKNDLWMQTDLSRFVDIVKDNPYSKEWIQKVYVIHHMNMGDMDT